MPFVSAAYLDHCNNHRQKEYIDLTFEHLTVGWEPTTGDALLIPEPDRHAGAYVLGVQGSGKSGLLENLIHQDADKNKAIIVIDPHGDLISNVIAAMPPYRLEQTYLLDMSDYEYPFGANLFSHAKFTGDPEAEAQAVDRIMHVFEVLWPEVLEQAHLPRYLRAAIIPLLAHPGATMLDLQNFLTDSAMRARLLKSVTDPTVRQFWRTQYDELPERERDNRVKALVARLEAVFMGRSLVRNIIGQKRTSISFRQAIENHEIILIRLPTKTVSQDARLIGLVLMARIHAAIFSFGDLPTDQRPGVSLYVDEVQHFATPDFTELFTEGRKFGVKVTIAHQFRNQLPGFLQDSTMTARTKVCFQTTPEDGRAMAHFFPSHETEIKPEDLDAHLSDTFLSRASAYGEIVERFVDGFLAPLQRYRRGRSKVEITSGGFDAKAVAVDLMSGSQGIGPIMVDDPTPFLDRLLYDVMLSHNWHLPIPWEIPRGFANSGKGFFAAARGAKEWELGPGALDKMPATLIVKTPDGDYRWTREPDGGRETLYYFIFCLRAVMKQLSEEPIGKVSEASTADVGRMLNTLPRRAAFVRSGDDVGVIYTYDTPEQVGSAEVSTRLAEIRNQTRAKYCHPRDDIERGFMDEDDQGGSGSPGRPGSPDQPDAPYTGWEEV